jgi:hypothetical protein
MHYSDSVIFATVTPLFSDFIMLYYSNLVIL